jgi:hypothetical protein
MSFASTTATSTPERGSQQYLLHTHANGGGVGYDIPTKIVEDDEDVDDLAVHGNNGDEQSAGDSLTVGPAGAAEQAVVGKHPESLIHRPSGARISALGGTR